MPNPSSYRRRTLACAAALLALAAWPGGDAAWALSPPPPPPCDIEFIAPAPFEYQLGQKSKGPMSLPANVPAFLALSDLPPLPAASLLDVGTNPPREVPLRVEPRGPLLDSTTEQYGLLPSITVASGGFEQTQSLLEAGHTYRFQTQRTCQGRTPTDLAFDFTVTPAAPLPTNVGGLVAIGQGIDDSSSRGASTLTFEVALRLEPSSEFLPWESAYTFDFVVDEEEDDYRGHVDYFSARDVLARQAEDGYTKRDIRCRSDIESSDPRAPERHTIRVVARPISFDAPALTTAPLEVSFDCSLPAPPRLPDESPPEQPPEQPEASATNRPQGMATAAKCAVASPGRPADGALALPGLALAAALATRRRRTR